MDEILCQAWTYTDICGGLTTLHSTQGRVNTEESAGDDYLPVSHSAGLWR
jgi:hypothetical protein